MRDPDRIPLILAAVERQWRTRPDQRLGQLLVNATRDEPGHDDPNPLFHLEDGRLLELLGPETPAESEYVTAEPARRRAGWREWEQATARDVDDASRQRRTADRLRALGARLDDLELAINDIHREANADDTTSDLIASLMTDVQRARLAAASVSPLALGMRAQPGVRLWIAPRRAASDAPAGWLPTSSFDDATRRLADSPVEVVLHQQLDDPDHRGMHVLDWLGDQQQRHGRGVWPRDGITLAADDAGQLRELLDAVGRIAGCELSIHEAPVGEHRARCTFDWGTTRDLR